MGKAHVKTLSIFRTKQQPQPTTTNAKMLSLPLLAPQNVSFMISDCKEGILTKYRNTPSSSPPTYAHPPPTALTTPPPTTTQPNNPGARPNNLQHPPANPSPSSSQTNKPSLTANTTSDVSAPAGSSPPESQKHFKLKQKKKQKEKSKRHCRGESK